MFVSLKKDGVLRNGEGMEITIHEKKTHYLWHFFIFAFIYFKQINIVFLFLPTFIHDRHLPHTYISKHA